MSLPLAFMGLPGGAEWIIILVVALLIFGKNLPSVMNSLGRSVTEFKKGMAGIEDPVVDSESEEQVATDAGAKKDSGKGAAEDKAA